MPPSLFTGDAVIDDGLGIMMIIEKLPWANTLDVTRGVEEALAEFRPAMQGLQVDTEIFRPATFIEDVGQQPRPGDADRVRPGGAVSWSSSCSSGGSR